ncbi:MAG: Undecaprenyl-phosphate mannosyltransferase [Parcubacteria group bacterium ADurb.Bin326]|nr:MAG: Undecaprenyl-phosphate mannosyltransferase [Parcubacteria group bacterium ADurb.Bin326]
MNILAVIPAYNESEKIGEVVSGLRNKANLPLDILVVNDGSKDETVSRAVEAGAIVISHAINRGQGAALKTGIDFAIKKNYQTVIFFDADGQMDPAEAYNLNLKLNEGYDVVLGSRNIGRVIDMPLSTKIVKKLALIFTRLISGLNLTDTHNGFQAWRISALSQIKLDQDRMAHASQILNEISRLKLKYCEVPVTIKYTNYSKRKGQRLWNSFNILWDLLIK